MAIASGGTLGANNSKVSATTIVLTTTATAEVGSFVLVAVAMDNNNGATTTGPNDVTIDCTDSAGNTYEKLAGAQNASGGTNTKSHAALFLGRITTQLTSGGTITATHTVSSRPARAISAWKFTADFDLVLLNRAHLHSAAVDPGALAIQLPTPTYDHLIVHCMAAEAPSTDTYTWDADYTQITSSGTTGSTADTNMTVLGGFRIASLNTTDTVDVTSDTADRDYTQVIADLVEDDGSFDTDVQIVDIAIAKATNGDPAVTHGFSLQNGDVLYAFHANEPDITPNLLSGFTNIEALNQGLGSDRGARLSYKEIVDAGSEPSTYSFTSSGSGAIVILIQVRNLDLTDGPNDLSATSDGLDNPNGANPAPFANYPGAILIFSMGSFSPQPAFTAGPPSGFTDGGGDQENGGGAFDVTAMAAYAVDLLPGIGSTQRTPGSWTSTGMDGGTDTIKITVGLVGGPPVTDVFVPQIIRYFA